MISTSAAALIADRLWARDRTSFRLACLRAEERGWTLLYLIQQRAWELASTMPLTANDR